MSELGFPTKDLARKKFQTALTILGLTLSIATTVFLVTFGQSLGFHVGIVAGGTVTPGFSYMFSVFILIVGVLNFLAGVLATSFLVSAAMSERVKDIGVMRATGCSSASAFSYFLTELSIMVFTSCVIGTILGILARSACISILNALGFSIAQTPLNTLSILVIFVAFVVAAHVIGVLPIRRATKVKPAEALSPIFSLGTTSAPKGPVPSKLGFSFKVAYRSLIRRRFVTWQAIICLAVVLTLTTLTIAGGVIANQTTQSYVERAVCRGVIVVGHPHITEQYEVLLSQPFEAKPTEQINYSDQRYMINESLVSELNANPEVRVDPRFILNTTIKEVPGVIINPEATEPEERYVFIGDHRVSEVLLIGVDPKVVVNRWMIFGAPLNETDMYSAVVGDSLAYGGFADALKQSFMFNERFDIKGIALDPLNSGWVVYVPYRALTGQTGYNLLLLKVEGTNRSETIAKLEETLSGTGLELLELNDALDKNLNFLGRVWSLVMILPLFSLGTATLCLLSYMMLSVTGQQRELGIMRALGAKPKTIMKMIFIQALIIVLVSGAIGITAGFIITWLFLIPEPVVSSLTMISITAWLLLALALIALTSLYPAVRVTQKSITGVIGQP